MLLKDETPPEEFLAIFRKKFTNFCEKAPILVSYKATPNTCFLFNEATKAKHEHHFDYTTDVSQNIRQIKEWLLENWYPVMVQSVTEERELTHEEIEQKIEQGTPTEEAVMQRHVDEYSVRWRIERVLIKKDELFVRNLEDGREYRYRMSMPITIFLKRLREKYNQFQAYDVFEEKAVFLNEIYPDYEERKDRGELQNGQEQQSTTPTEPIRMDSTEVTSE